MSFEAVRQTHALGVLPAHGRPERHRVGGPTEPVPLRTAVRQTHALGVLPAHGRPERHRVGGPTEPVGGMRWVEEDRVSEIYLLQDVETEQEWQERALCAQTDPEAFFPEKGGSTREAKRVCLSCDVRQDCLEYALAHDERFGIWGGLSERERRRLKKQAV